MSRKAYTMIEVIIAISIMGLLATMAIPRLVGQQECEIFSEGVSAVQVFYAAQGRYFLDHDAFATNCANLDVTLIPKNFAAPTCANSDPIVSVARSGGPVYTIEITSAGVFSASGAGYTPNLVRYLPD